MAFRRNRPTEYTTAKPIPLSGVEAIMPYVKAMSAAAYVTTNRTNIIAALNKRANEKRATTRGAFGISINTSEGEGKRWVHVPEKIQTIQHVKDIFFELGTCLGVARKLNDEGIPSPDGGSWGPAGVKRILTRPVYRGWTTHGGKRIEHPELTVLTPNEIEKIDSMLASSSRRPYASTPRHLSTPFVRCGVCLGALTVSSSSRSKSKSLVCDRQRSHACEGIGYKSESKVDHALLAAVSPVVDVETWARVKEILRAALEEQKKRGSRKLSLSGFDGRYKAQNVGSRTSLTRLRKPTLPRRGLPSCKLSAPSPPASKLSGVRTTRRRLSPHRPRPKPFWRPLRGGWSLYGSRSSLGVSKPSPL